MYITNSAPKSSDLAQIKGAGFDCVIRHDERGRYLSTNEGYLVHVAYTNDFMQMEILRHMRDVANDFGYNPKIVTGLSKTFLIVSHWGVPLLAHSPDTVAMTMGVGGVELKPESFGMRNGKSWETRINALGRTACARRDMKNAWLRFEELVGKSYTRLHTAAENAAAGNMAVMEDAHRLTWGVTVEGTYPHRLDKVVSGDPDYNGAVLELATWYDSGDARIAFKPYHNLKEHIRDSYNGAYISKSYLALAWSYEAARILAYGSPKISEVVVHQFAAALEAR